MESESKFYVMTSGKIRPGFDMKDVEGSVASLFKVSRERARGILTSKRVLKKDLAKAVAQKYQRRLEGIGVDIRLVQLPDGDGDQKSAPQKSPPAKSAQAEAPAKKRTATEIRLPSPIESDFDEPDTGATGLIKTTNKLPDMQLTLEPISKDSQSVGMDLSKASMSEIKKSAADERVTKPSANTDGVEQEKIKRAVALALQAESGQADAGAVSQGTMTAPTARSLGAGLELQPLAGEAAAAEDSKVRIECPKCGLEQAKTEQCQGCGVYMHKVQQQALATQSFASQSLASQASASGAPDAQINAEPVGKQSGGNLALVLALVAAIAGAYIWRAMVIYTGYEIGYMAWIIGGMVGFCAALGGSRGESTGVACAVLACLAILGGKYMAYEAIFSDFDLLMDEIGLEEMRPLYEQLVYEAEMFRELPRDDATIRGFIANYGYSDSFDPEGVTQDEVDYFNAYIAPELNQLAYSPPPYETWIQDTYEEEVENVSTISLLLEELDYLDFIFLALALVTAYRVGGWESAA